MVPIRPDSEDLLRRKSANPEAQRSSRHTLSTAGRLRWLPKAPQLRAVSVRDLSFPFSINTLTHKKEIHHDFSDFRMKLQHYKMETKKNGVCVHALWTCVFCNLSLLPLGIFLERIVWEPTRLLNAPLSNTCSTDLVPLPTVSNRWRGWTLVLSKQH